MAILTEIAFRPGVSDTVTLAVQREGLGAVEIPCVDRQEALLRAHFALLGEMSDDTCQMIRPNKA